MGSLRLSLFVCYNPLTLLVIKQLSECGTARTPCGPPVSTAACPDAVNQMRHLCNSWSCRSASEQIRSRSFPRRPGSRRELIKPVRAARYVPCLQACLPEHHVITQAGHECPLSPNATDAMPRSRGPLPALCAPTFNLHQRQNPATYRPEP